MRALYNRLLFLLAVLSALPSFGYAQVRESGAGEPGPVKPQQLTAELISDSEQRTRWQEPSRLALMLEPGWHVYWFYAGDSGEPPVVAWSAPTGLSLGPMQYPVPFRLPLGPLMDYGYEGTPVFPFDLSTSPQTPLGNVDLKAHVR